MSRYNSASFRSLLSCSLLTVPGTGHFLRLWRTLYCFPAVLSLQTSNLHKDLNKTISLLSSFPFPSYGFPRAADTLHSYDVCWVHTWPAVAELESKPNTEQKRFKRPSLNYLLISVYDVESARHQAPSEHHSCETESNHRGPAIRTFFPKN